MAEAADDRLDRVVCVARGPLQAHGLPQGPGRRDADGSGGGDPVQEPGLTDEKKLYKYIAFKGGSEPGVLNMTWLMQRKIDDKWVFLTVGFNDSGNLIDDMKAVLAVSTARDFLGR